MTDSASGINFWVRHVTATDSTQDHVFRMARAITSPPPTGTVVVADRQSRGRGREGRSWLSPTGGLYFSILVHESDLHNLGPAVAGHSPILKLPLIAGLAVADAVAAYGGHAAIKWPNDVILLDPFPPGPAATAGAPGKGRKLAGILCEAKEGRVAIGIGVNLVEAPLPTAASLAELWPSADQRPVRDGVLEQILAAFAARLARTDTSAEVDARLWRKGDHAFHNGAPIVIKSVAESGALVAQTDRGLLEIISGELTFAEDSANEITDDTATSAATPTNPEAHS